ncbi:RsmB/NOP family class I SAM-dependent RNA methyltransferase [Rothia kristinae]|uniref:RsmB/NOP family class I SAM-dependent RNA methyltransferase n=1 Tax=Rothia kristinae TaxID=37923 RepID=UPI0011A50924|nr:transcription antitermination factor NusB [Rothia kristinae]MED6046117.1 transcription antitermination factor NusB [Rothia kristinae]
MSAQQGRGRGGNAGSGPGRGGQARPGERRNAKGRQRHRGAGPQRDFSRTAPSQRRRTGDPARLVAFETLQAVQTEDAYANLVLPRSIRRHRLDQRDAAWATELTYGTLREQGLYDAILARCVDRPLARLDAKVLTVLRLGAHQLLGMRTAAHAAINETVGLTRAVVGAGPAGMVNAVLRRVSERTREQWLAELTADLTDETRRLALERSHPVWIVRALRQALAAHGRVPTEIEQLLAADNDAPVVHLAALPGLGSLEEAERSGAEASTLVPGAATYRHGDIGRLETVRAGTVRAQDAGSQLVARALAAAPLDGEDGRWLDLCAGPGGKAALLGALAQQRGAELVANESAPHRAELVRTSLRPLGPAGYAVLTGDGRRIRETLADAEQLPEQTSLAVEAFGESGEIFDRVLVDAPCTGLGALRRRPEARWRKQPADVAELLELQTQLGRAAIEVTRPGGVIAYVTCSPHAAETQNVLADLLETGQVQLLDTAAITRDAALPHALDGEKDPGLTAPDLAPAEGQDRASTVQLWPHVHGTDAMFLALLRRI